MIFNIDKKDKVFWKIIAIALAVVLYLFALNGRYEFGPHMITDKWTKKSLLTGEHIQYKWIKWTKNPRE